MDAPLALLLDLRLRLRDRPEGRAIVDHCLALVARAEAAGGDPEVQAQLEAEVRRLEDWLHLRFGAPRTAALQ